MNSLYIDCSRGIAGDMLTSALLDMATAQQQKLFLQKSNNLIKNVKTEYRKVKKFNLAGSSVDVITDDNKEEFSVDVKSKKVSSMDIKSKLNDDLDPFDVIDNFDLSPSCKYNVEQTFRLLMDTESFVHNCKTNHAIHFNRIGSIDALIDIANVCILLKMLNINDITSSPVNTGYGQVKYNKKVFSVPAPATKKLLEGIPNYHTDIYGELCTPTGVALLKYFVPNFISLDLFHNSIEKVGIGFGQKVFSNPTFVKCLLIKHKD